MLNWTVASAAAAGVGTGVAVGWTRGVRSWGSWHCTTRLACWLVNASLLNMLAVSGLKVGIAQR